MKLLRFFIMLAVKRGTPIILIIIFIHHLSMAEPGNDLSRGLIIKSVGEPDFVSNVINDIAQDHLGYLWIGTSKGLYRHDGKEFEELELQTGYDSRTITCLLVDTRNTLWIGRIGGITGYDGMTINEYNVGGEQQVNITNIVEDNQGDIWFTSSSGKLYKTMSDGSIFAINAFKRKVSAIAKGPEGHLILGTTDGGIFRSDDEGYEEISRLDEAQVITCIQFLPDSRMIIGSSDGLYDWKMSNITESLKLFPGSEHLHINQVAISGNETIWLAAESGLYQFVEDRFMPVDKRQGFGAVELKAVFVDREDNLWIGTGSYGLFRFFGERFLFLNKGTRPESRIARFMKKDASGRLWVGYFGDGLEVYERDKVSRFSLSNGFISDYVRDGYLDSKNNMWIASTRGIARFNGERIDYFTEKDGLENNYSHHITEDQSGNIWITSFSGLSRFDGTRFSTFSKAEGLVGERIECIQAIKDDGLLVSTDGGIDLIKKKKINNIISNHDLQGRVISHLAIDRNKIIWGASAENEILKIDISGKEIEVVDKLENGGRISFILFDNSNRLVIGLKREILVCELEGTRIKSRVIYGSNSGMNVTEINRDAYYLDENNQIWIGTENGVYIFNPEIKDSGDQFPVVAITDVLVPDLNNEWSQHSDSLESWNNVPTKFTLPFAKNDFIFRFKGNSMKQPDGIIFRCMLKGHEADWSKSFSDNFVTYNNLKPGKYQFHVQGSFDGINWYGKDTSIQFQIIPPFYRTIWFYVIVLAVLLLLFILYNNNRIRLRIHQIMEIEKARVAESEKIRKKVAMDFHDEVGNQLTGISMLAQLISRKSDKLPSDLRVLLQRIDLESRNLFQGTKDFIWSIDPENDNLKEVYYNIRDYGEDLLDNSNIIFHTQNGDTDSMDIKLPAGYSRQMALIFKEGLNYTAKCEGCRNVHFAIKTDDDKVIEINLKTDTNKIIDDLDFREGVKKMKERSQRIRSELIVNSNESEGLEIVLKVTSPCDREKIEA